MTIDGFSMWDTTSEEVSAEHTARDKRLAEAAVQPLWSYLAASGSDSEFTQRLALSAEHVDRLVAQVGVPDRAEDASEALRARWAAEAPQRQREAAAAQVAASLRSQGASKPSLEEAQMKAYDALGVQGWSSEEDRRKIIDHIKGQIKGHDYSTSEIAKATDNNAHAATTAYDELQGKTSGLKDLDEGGLDKELRRVMEQQNNTRTPEAQESLKDWRRKVEQEIADRRKGSKTSHSLGDRCSECDHTYDMHGGAKGCDQCISLGRDNAGHAFVKAASKTAGYAIVSPEGHHLWQMVYDTEDGAKAHHDTVKRMKGSFLVPEDIDKFEVKEVGDKPNRTYDRHNKSSPFQPHHEGFKTAAEERPNYDGRAHEITCPHCSATFTGPTRADAEKQLDDHLRDMDKTSSHRTAKATNEETHDFKKNSWGTTCTRCGMDKPESGDDWVPACSTVSEGFGDHEGSRRTAKWIDQARAIVGDKGFRTVTDEGEQTETKWRGDNVSNNDGSMVLDTFTASMLVQLYDALSPANQAKFDAMSLTKAVDIGWKLVNKVSTKATRKTAGNWVNCHHCPLKHPAEYSHEGRFGEGPIFAVVCTTDDWVTDYYTTEGLTLDSDAFAPQGHIGSMQKGAPFAGYEDFEACVKANSDKDNPEAYCGKIKHQVEDGKTSANWLQEYFSAWSEEHPGKKQCSFTDAEGRCQKEANHEGGHAPVELARAASYDVIDDLASPFVFDTKTGQVVSPTPLDRLFAEAAEGPLPPHLQEYWGNRTDDPRDKPAFCAKQSHKTPAIPWHNGDPCLACGKSREEWVKTSAVATLLREVEAEQRLEYECQKCHHREYRWNPAAPCSNCGAPSTEHKIVGRRKHADYDSNADAEAAANQWNEDQGHTRKHVCERDGHLFVGGDTCLVCGAKESGLSAVAELLSQGAAEEDWLEIEGAFFHHPQPPNPTPRAPRGNTAPHHVEDTINHMREQGRTERTEQRQTDQRHEEYWQANPEEAERHMQQNAGRRVGAYDPFDGAADWDIFGTYVDDEGQFTYTIYDSTGDIHHLDEDDAGHLLDSLNGHAAPTPLSQLIEGGSKEASRRQASVPTYQVKKVHDSVWLDAGESTEEAGEVIKAGVTGSEEEFWLLRNNFNGAVNVYAYHGAMKGIDSSQPPRNMGSYEQFYGQPYREASRRQAVNDSAYGTERYQAQPQLSGTPWPDAWEKGKASQEELDQGRAAHEPENPFADRLTTVRQSALRHLAVDLEGFEQPDAFERPGTTDPQTTRPRVLPNQHRDPSMSNPMVTEPAVPAEGGGGVDMMPGNHGFEMGVDPTVPTVDQMVAAKIARLARRIKVDNPSMEPGEAKALAAKTVARYPEMVRG